MAVYGTSGYLTAVGALMTKFDVTLVWCAIVAAVVTFWYLLVKYGGRAVEEWAAMVEWL